MIRLTSHGSQFLSIGLTEIKKQSSSPGKRRIQGNARRVSGGSPTRPLAPLGGVETSLRAPLGTAIIAP